MDKSDITPELLRQLLRYEPDTGKLFWKSRSSDYFDKEWHRKRWNDRYADREAFTSNTRGYQHGSVFDIKFRTHRVAWAIYYGEWPDGHIDHINHKKTDNRIVNLRVVSIQENARNQTMRRSNTSGFTGVVWHKANHKWLAQITSDGTIKHLGCFDTVEQAVAVRKAAEVQFGFHKNHGAAALAKATQ